MGCALLSVHLSVRRRESGCHASAECGSSESGPQTTAIMRGGCLSCDAAHNWQHRTEQCVSAWTLPRVRDPWKCEGASRSNLTTNSTSNLTSNRCSRVHASHAIAIIFRCWLRATAQLSKSCKYACSQSCDLRHYSLFLPPVSADLCVAASNLQSACRMGASRVGNMKAVIPESVDEVDLRIGHKSVRLTNLRKPFWPSLHITKGDLLRYYLAMSSYLIPHLRNRAMVMKRYPNGANGKCFFMKRAPSPRPEWIATCEIEHDSGNVIDFPMVQDVASLLWVINLGCIDLNQWYSRCDDTDRPDYLHFDLDPAKGAPFARVLEVAMLVRGTLQHLGIPALAKTSGATGLHVYVPIRRGPLQKQVWTFARALAQSIAEENPKLATAEYIIAKRPYGRVFVDYNQNAWGKTLASVYSVRPTKRATVSTPVTWEEVQNGIDREAFRMDTVPERVRVLGDLWAPLLAAKGRVRLEQFL